ncbi:MAG: NADH-quinone oxidoreductase subunit L [Planctomycetaceae bacterium]
MSESTRQAILWLIPLAPLAAALVTAVLGPKLLRQRSHLPCWAALAASAICSLLLLFVVLPETFGSESPSVLGTGYQWMHVGGIDVRVDLRADAMTGLMLSMVTVVSLLVAIFAASYMHGDPGFARFFAAFSFFVFSMCMLVLSANFLLLYVFWEAVGLCSYLLIGFWYQRPSAAAAAKKAFVVNRIGDFGFMIALFLIWTTFGSFDFSAVLGQPDRLAAVSPDRMTLICLLLFLGAMGKSAQFPLHVWLPDAMEGPTPVSALIHAATMVTAGVYLIARCTPLFVFAPSAHLTVSAIGAITALLAALIALTQNDLKRVLAYSTVSQLGYMFMALGAGAASAETATAGATAGVFHLITHGFFKALLFLAAGSVMHAMGDVIDIRRFGGLRRALPITHATFLCGAVALAGLPVFSGFWSKDDILAVLAEAARHPQHGAFFGGVLAVATITALLTAFYTFRAYFLTFWGDERFPEEAGHHPHEALPVMAWPLWILAGFALAIGIAVGPTHLFAEYIQHTPGVSEIESHGMHFEIMAISTVVAVAGLALAWLFYVRSPYMPGRLATALKPAYTMSLNKFFLDELFEAIVVMPLRGLARLAELTDAILIDPLVDAIGSIPKRLSSVPLVMHNGLISSYALVMWAGVVVCVLLVLELLS